MLRLFKGLSAEKEDLDKRDNVFVVLVFNGKKAQIV